MTKFSSGLKTLFLVHFVVGVVVGLLYMFVPKLFGGWFGMSISDEFPYRIIGAAVLGFTASSWYCYNADAWEKVKIVVLAEIVWTGLNTLICMYSLFLGGAPAGIWVNLVIMAGFAIAFAYFYNKK